ncbi:DNA-binding transcriptional regulator, MerR family [Terribacillus aidingensis]|uniref:DNA-binding transcriptional regulator, MerR family n=1 Tax=Terribacillus aidingensis TaxID=586416 RepID=A0A285P2X0_9BACI|nr:helix-turn-helix domain-containing protein [Terribacillus aidingensis]SNZ16075.1 DNA-binding transcriptional regulator, MerR family [Terribacillus aidingensis]
MSEQEIQYTAKDLAASLEVTTSTLRRWAIALESAHYPFKRNSKGQRIYTEKDLTTLDELKRLLAEKRTFADAIQQLTGYDKLTEQPAKELEDPVLASNESEKVDSQVLNADELEKIVSHAVKKAVKKEREKLFKQLKKQMKKEMEKLKKKKA